MNANFIFTFLNTYLFHYIICTRESPPSGGLRSPFGSGRGGNLKKKYIYFYYFSIVNTCFLLHFLYVDNCPQLSFIVCYELSMGDEKLTYFAEICTQYFLLSQLLRGPLWPVFQNSSGRAESATFNLSQRPVARRCVMISWIFPRHATLFVQWILSEHLLYYTYNLAGWLIL